MKEYHLVHLTKRALSSDGSKWIPSPQEGLPGVDTAGGVNQPIGLSPTGDVYIQGVAGGDVGGGTYASHDAGQHWAPIPNPHTDGHAWGFATDSSSPEGYSAYAGNDGGIWRFVPSLVSGQFNGTWNSLSTLGLSTNLVGGASFFRPNIFMAEGSQDLGASAATTMAASNTLGLGTSDSGETRIVDGVFYTTNGGNLKRYEVNDIIHGRPVAKDITPPRGLGIYATDPFKLLVASPGNTISQSINGGDSWTNFDIPSKHNGNLPDPNYSPPLAIAPSDDKTIFVADSNGQKLWKTVNGGQTWTEVDSGSNWAGGRIYGIAIDPANLNSVYLITNRTIPSPLRVGRSLPCREGLED